MKMKGYDVLAFNATANFVKTVQYNIFQIVFEFYVLYIEKEKFV